MRETERGENVQKENCRFFRDFRSILGETKKKTDGGYRSREMRRADAMRKQQIKQIEDEISYLEQTCKTLEEELSCEEVYSSFELTREKSLELESANKRLEECFEEWEKLSEE